jgi:competence protein ComEC
VLSVCLLPLGLEAAGLWVMGLGLDWILGVARWISALEGARGTVISPGPWVLPLLSVGAMTVILWRGRFRMAGVLPVLVAAALWAQAERPSVLIADTGGLVGIMTDEGRALSTPRGAGFVALNWLENDGDAADQAAAAGRWSGSIKGPGGVVITPVRGKGAASALSGCAANELLVMNADPPENLRRDPGCKIMDPATLRRTGAVALYDLGAGKAPRFVTAREISGARLWNAR